MPAPAARLVPTELVLAGQTVGLLERLEKAGGLYPFKAYLLEGPARRYVGESYDQAEAVSLLADAYLDAGGVIPTTPTRRRQAR